MKIFNQIKNMVSNKSANTTLLNMYNSFTEGRRNEEIYSRTQMHYNSKAPTHMMVTSKSGIEYKKIMFRIERNHRDIFGGSFDAQTSLSDFTPENCTVLQYNDGFKLEIYTRELSKVLFKDELRIQRIGDKSMSDGEIFPLPEKLIFEFRGLELN